MLLTAILTALRMTITWDVPHPGTSYLLSTQDYLSFTVEASYHCDTPCHAAWSEDRAAMSGHKFFVLEFVPDKP